MDDPSVAADFDHRDEEAAYNPFPRWKALREEGIGYSKHHGGFYVASRYEDVCAIARNQKIFSSHLRQVSIPQLVTPPLPPIHFDPPEHRQYRVMVNAHFSPAKVREYEPWIRELSQKYTQRLLAAERFDVTRELGIPLTRDVILRIMGIDQAPADVNRWSDDLIFQTEDAAEGGANLMAFLAEEISKRRRNPGPDVVSALITEKFEDRHLTDDEVQRTSLLLLLAGLDTTNSAISGSIWYLLQNPGKAAELARADDVTWRLAMDEFIRWTSPAPSQSRTIREDTEVNGCPLKKGEMVMMVYGAANRDESEFPNPDEVVFDRRPNRHVGFGIGGHRCLGMHLAKLELQVVLEQLIGELGAFEMENPEAITWVAAENRGIKSLPLVRKRA